MYINIRQKLCGKQEDERMLHIDDLHKATYILILGMEMKEFKVTVVLYLC